MTSARVNTFYRKFECLGGACPASCCKGWNVPVDDETWRYYKSLPGILGTRLRLSQMTRPEPVFALGYKDCEYHDRDGLCRLQKELGIKGIPEVCRRYPRLFENMGEYTAGWLDLSCIHAATLFLSETERMGFTEEIGDAPEVRPSGNNEDGDFLACLEQVREGMIRLLEDAIEKGSMESAGKALLFIPRFSLAAQNACIRGDYGLLLRPMEELAQELPSYEGEAEGYLPCAFSFVDGLFRCFYNSALKKQSPHLYALCQLYLAEYGSRTAEEKEKKHERLITAYMEEVPDALAHYLRYIEYSLCQHCFSIYEDYSFTRWMLRGIVDGSLILELMALSRKKEGRDLTSLEKAHVIAVAERRARHNPGTFKRMGKAGQDYFYGKCGKEY